MKRRSRKKPYVLKKDEAVLKSDPVARAHAEEDERTHAKALDEADSTTADATQIDLAGERRKDGRVRGNSQM